LQKNGNQKGSSANIINKLLSVFIGICIVVCLILSIIAIAKNITEEPPAEEYTPPPVVGDMTTPASITDPADPFTETVLTTAATAPAETSAETAETTATTAQTVTSDETAETAAQTETSTVSAAIAATPAADDYDKEFFSNWLFVGDSIFTGLYGYNYLSSSNVFAKIGLNPASVRTTDNNGTTVYQKLAVSKPDIICIMLGTNGLAYLSIDSMITDYGKFIDEIKELLPDTRIIILSLTPVTKVHSDTKPETLELVTSYNEALKTLAEEKETDYFDIFTDLSDDEGYSRPEYAENDGLHLKGAAYKRVLWLLEDYVKNGEEESGNE
jgi:lysophospholipase L1-like esterase